MKQKLPKWIKLKYLIPIIIFMAKTIQALLRQCFVLSLRDLATINVSISYAMMDDNLTAIDTYRMRITRYSYYMGFFLSNIPAGILSDLYGGKILMLSGLLINSLLILGYHFYACQVPWFILSLVSGGIGLGYGLILPAVFSILAHWIPDNQITFFCGGTESSFFVGRILITHATNIFTEGYGFWNLMFKLSGSAGLLISLLILIFIHSTPEHCKMATYEEKHTMEQFIGIKKTHKICWKKILRDEAIWAITIQHIGHKWQYYVLIIHIETWSKQLSETSSDPITGNLSINLLLAAISTVVSSFVANYVINKGKIPRVYVRAICIILGNIVSSVFIIIMYDTDAKGIFEAALRVSALSATGIHYASGQTNVLDITRHYAGSIVGLQNSLAAISGYLMEALVEARKMHDFVHTWQALYDLAFSVTFMTTLIYLIWARAERATWDVVVEDEVEEEEEFVG